MTKNRTVKPPNLAAKQLGTETFRQRVVKASKSYRRKTKHSKREDQSNELPFFVMDTPAKIAGVTWGHFTR